MQDKLFNLHRAFQQKQNALRNDLEADRKIPAHPVAKGDGSELHWKDMLSKFLPSRYLVSKGFVVDSKGECSEQIDVIIHNHVFSPFLWESGGHVYVPAESVYAVFEVKQDHRLGHIKYAGQKAASVRRRVRTESSFGWIQGTTEKRELFTILAGLLTVDSEWNPALGDPFYRALGNLPQEVSILSDP